MHTLLQYRKAAAFFTILMGALIYSSCAHQKNGKNIEILDPLSPDIGSVVEKPIGNSEFSDDITINIQCPDINVDGDETESNESSEDTDTSGGGDNSDNLIPDYSSDNENSSDTDDNDIMGEYEGSNTDIDSDENQSDSTDDSGTVDCPSFNPGDVEIGENSGAIDLYDVPLSAEKQSYVFKMAEQFNIPQELIFGVMYVETRYTETAVSGNGKYIGIMQIAKSNLKRLNKKFGITDLTDYLQNVKAGAYFLSYFYKRYDGNINKVLMCYHCGEGGAIARWRNGVTLDSYCRKVIKEIGRIRSAD